MFPWGAPFTSCRPQRRQGRFPHRVERPIKRVAPGAGGNPTGAGGVVTNRGQSCVTRPRPPYKSGAALRRERPRARTVTAAVLPVRRGQPADDVGCAAGGRQSGRGRDESAGRASSLHTEYPANLLGSRLRGNDERRGEETRRAGGVVTRPLLCLQWDLRAGSPPMFKRPQKHSGLDWWLSF